MALPHPSENPHWPSWFYPPETSEDDPAASGRIFGKAEDVPAGWACNWRDHGVNLHREPPPAPAPALSRREVAAELTKRDIAFAPNVSRAEMDRLLAEAIAAEDLDDSV